MTRIISKVVTNIDVPSSQTTPPVAPQFSYLLPNSPTNLYSLNIAVDSTFQSNYSYLVVISTIIQDGNDYRLFPSNQTSYEFVPQTLQGGIPLAPNTLIQIYAYNSNAAASDGHFSVSILASTNE
ncbi:MAG: hypothetical protein QXH07_03100 [Thermoplasmata archaeon]